MSRRFRAISGNEEKRTGTPVYASARLERIKREEYWVVSALNASHEYGELRGE